MDRRNVTTLAVIYLGYLLVATLYPFQFSFPTWDSVGLRVPRFYAFPSSRDFILNVPLFMPLGMLLYCRLFPIRNKPLAILLAIFIGASTSLVIEVLQLFFYRDSSAFDVLANTLGAGCGALAAGLWPNRLIGVVGHCWRRLEKAGVVLAIAVLFGAVPFVLSVVQHVAPFGVWNPRFTFQLGNEATLDRPWLGKIHFVALYNRALSAQEISKNYYQGLTAGTRLREGLVSLYTFSEREGDIVHDSAGVEPPLDLSFGRTGRVRWLESVNGLEFMGPAILQSREPARKLAAAVRATGQLAVEAWVTPSSAAQHGPARIVSFSRDPVARNFTLGQRGSEIEFRLRTPVTGRNGSLFTLATSDRLAALEIAHIVATYRDGVERLYVNGKEQPRSLDLTSEGMIGFGAGRTPAAAAAYAFFYFFPAGFFAAGFLSRWSRGFVRATVLSTALAAGLLITSELFQVFVFDRAIDILLIAFGLLAAALGSVASKSVRVKG
jgi:glycopeptide antibiotics resistance protein